MSEPAPALSEIEKERYARQMMIQGWGQEGQKKLKAARVFVAGAGGLGCPAAVNLALAGVGVLRICDGDSTERSNLNRQFLHDDSRIGINKALSAKTTLSRINPFVEIETISERITQETVDSLVGDSQIIVDCVDNFPARYVLNDCAVRKRIPMVHGAIWGFEGRMMFIHPPQTACLACLFPEAPPAEAVPVLGATPGVVGCMQAMEAIKYLLGVGKLLRNQYLVADFATMGFKTLNVRKDPSCPVCDAAE